MSLQLYKILIFSAWFLIPLLPAFILYKFLPNNQVAVSGPFKGLKLDMAGAFAGYFVLILAAYFIVKQMIFEKPVEYEIWTLKGFITDDKKVPLGKERNKPDITVYPPIEIDNGRLDFPILVRVADKHYDFPGISISAYSKDDPGAKLYFPSDFMNDLLDPDINYGEKKAHWEYDFKNRILKFNKPFEMIRETQLVSADSSKNILTVDSVATN